MKLNMEPKPVLSICLNPAWERRLFFREYRQGGVNRAYRMGECGGGKGVNVLRALRCLGVPAKVATFIGGSGVAGDYSSALVNEIGSAGIFVKMAAPLRTCCELVDEGKGTVTEIIDSSPEVSEEELSAMMTALEQAIPSSGAVACCGTASRGIGAECIGMIASMACDAEVPLIVDSVFGVENALREKVAVLKVNAEELLGISHKADIENAALALLENYPGLSSIAVTEGAEGGRLFGRDGACAYRLPLLSGVVSPIGAGDCATAVVLRRLAEGNVDMRDVFCEALACASASCLEECPSYFRCEVAEEILGKIKCL